MKVESKLTTIASAPGGAFFATCVGSRSATLKVCRRKLSGSAPASTGNSCANTSAATR
jgi:hypothetical protein